VALSPEVTGRIVFVHPRLEVGEVIDREDVLFKIEDSDYRAALLEAQASMSQHENTILRLQKQYASIEKGLRPSNETGPWPGPNWIE
jgi:multidrug resistance efflux pump